jgi:hypothetical protein
MLKKLIDINTLIFMSVCRNVIQRTTIRLCSFITNFIKLVTLYLAYLNLRTCLASQESYVNSTHSPEHVIFCWNLSHSYTRLILRPMLISNGISSVMILLFPLRWLICHFISTCYNRRPLRKRIIHNTRTIPAIHKLYCCPYNYHHGHE